MTYQEKVALGNMPEMERIKAMLTYSGFRHVSKRSWGSTDMLMFYETVPKSPTGCELMGGVNDNEENRKIVYEHGKNICAGGHMGNA